MEQLGDQDDRGGASRRSRKDIQGRDFICGCGKKYLSYPALYTHIKTKHDGRQPEGTQKTGSTVAVKRKSKIEDEFLTQIQNIIKKQDVKLLEVVDQSLQGSTPLHSRIKKQLLPKQTYEAYQNLTKQNNWIKLTKDSSLDAVMAVYLVGIGQHVVEKLHQQYCLFAKLLRQCYYTLGQQIYQKCFSKKEGGLGYIATFTSQRVKYLPIICDFFCRFFLPFDYKEVNKDLMGLLLYDFCDWLKKMKLTFINVSLNKQYKLQKPLQLISRAPKRQKPSCNQKQNQSHYSNQNKQFNEMISDMQNQKHREFQDSPKAKSHIDQNQQNQRKSENEQQSAKKQQNQKVNANQEREYQIQEPYNHSEIQNVEVPSQIKQNNIQKNLNKRASEADAKWSSQPQAASQPIEDQIRQIQQEIKDQELLELQKLHGKDFPKGQVQSQKNGDHKKQAQGQE